MSGKYNIGDVLVIRGEPPKGNPYLGDSLYGVERSEALRKFMHNIHQPKLTFWYGPCCGGAKRCTKDEVDWDSSGISVGEWEDEPDGHGVRCKKCNTRVWKSDRRKCKCDSMVRD